MDKEEFQKKYDNSVLVCCTENSIKKVFNICDLMDLTAMQIYWGRNKDTLTISLLPEVERVRLDDDELEVFRKAFHILHKCNEWVMEDNKKQSKEPTFNKGNKIMYTIKDGNGNTYPVSRLSERVYESKEHKTLFITDKEGIVTGIYKEK